MTNSSRVADGVQKNMVAEDVEAAAYTVLRHCEASEFISWPLVQIGLYAGYAIHHKLAVFDLHMGNSWNGLNLGLVLTSGSLQYLCCVPRQVCGCTKWACAATTAGSMMHQPGHNKSQHLPQHHWLHSLPWAVCMRFTGT